VDRRLCRRPRRAQNRPAAGDRLQDSHRAASGSRSAQRIYPTCTRLGQREAAVASRTENAINSALGLAYMEPELWEGDSEIELASATELRLRSLLILNYIPEIRPQHGTENATMTGTPSCIRATRAVLIPARLLGACAHTPMGPTVQVLPGPNKSLSQFQSDQAICRSFAQQAVNDRAQALICEGSRRRPDDGARGRARRGDRRRPRCRDRRCRGRSRWGGAWRDADRARRIPSRRNLTQPSSSACSASATPCRAWANDDAASGPEFALVRD
jgi:hypothetical protein